MQSQPATQGAALIYCRVSTKGQEQDGTSLDSQEAACVRHAEALGMSVGRVTRETYSGGELWDRPLLARDRADLRSGQFAALIAYSTDRLSRNPVHLALIAEECERVGVALHFVSEPLDNSPEGQLIRYVRGYAGQVEREKIRERQLRGKHQRAVNGKVHGSGRELYGYLRDKERGVRLVCDEEAAIVRQIFDWVAVEHISLREIVRRLTARGVPAPSAGKVAYGREVHWCRNTLLQLIRNPSYKGEAVAWRTQRPSAAKDRLRPDYDAVRGKIIRPEEEWVRLPDGVTPAIVSADAWQAAHDALHERRAAYATRNASRPYLLRGLVYCATCGRRMQGIPERSSRVYRCSSRDTAIGPCGGARIPGEALEEWAWAQVASVLRNPDLIAAELKRRKDEGPDASLLADLETAKQRLATLERRQADYLRRYSEAEDGTFPWELVEREIKRLEAEKVGWTATIADLEDRLQARELVREQLEALHVYCERVGRNLDAFTFDDKRLALEALQVRVTGNGREWRLDGSIPLHDDAAVRGVVSTTQACCGPQQRPPPARA
jgi:site-specific DNA recombinase